MLFDEESVHPVWDTSKKNNRSFWTIDTTFSVQTLLVVPRGGLEWKATLTVITWTATISLPLDALREAGRAVQAATAVNINELERHRIESS